MARHVKAKTLIPKIAISCHCPLCVQYRGSEYGISADIFSVPFCEELHVVSMAASYVARSQTNVPVLSPEHVPTLEAPTILSHSAVTCVCARNIVWSKVGQTKRSHCSPCRIATANGALDPKFEFQRLSREPRNASCSEA